MSHVFRKPFIQRLRRGFVFAKATQTVTPASVVASFVIPTATLVLGAVTVSPAAVTASFSIPTPTLVVGAVTVSPAPVTAIFSIPTPTLVNVLTVTPASVVATYSIPTPVLVGGTVTVQPASVTAAFSITTPTLTVGSLTIFPSPVVATFSIPTPVLVAGQTVAPDPVVATFSIPLAVAVGDRFIVGDSATDAWVGEEDHIAIVDSLTPTVWSFTIPKVGYSLYRLETNESLTWDGDGWQALTGYGKVTVITTTYTANKKHFIQADDDTAGGVMTITLPLLTTVVGGYIVNKIGSTSNVVIQGTGSDTINDASSQTLATQYASYTFVKGSSTNWSIT